MIMKAEVKMFCRFIAVLTLLFIAGCSREPMPEAVEVAKRATLETGDYFLFAAEQPVTDACYIFYTGGLVKEVAYAPYAEAMAQRGVHTFLLKITLDMSALEQNAPNDAKNSEFARENCRSFAVGGHSLGGLSASRYALENPDDGIVMVSAYPYKKSIVDHRGPIMSIYGSLDPLSTEEQILGARDLVPESAMYRSVEGGNHSQFGWYGEQGGDAEATISREQQQAALVEHTLELMMAMPNTLAQRD